MTTLIARLEPEFPNETVELVTNDEGFDLVVCGTKIGFIDFFYARRGGPVQIVIDGTDDDQPVAKLVLVTPEAIDLIVDGNLIQETRVHPQGFRHDEADHVFEL